MRLINLHRFSWCFHIYTLTMPNDSCASGIDAVVGVEQSRTQFACRLALRRAQKKSWHRAADYFETAVIQFRISLHGSFSDVAAVR